MKKVKILTITLIIALIAMIAFLGIYVQVQNRMENKVKDYSYAMDLKGTRNIRLKVDDSTKTVIKDSEGKEVQDAEELTEEQIAEKGYTKEEVPYNSTEVLTEENYIKSKEIIEKRLKELKIDNYTLKLDKESGDIIIEIAEDEKTDAIVSNIGTPGKFKIVDSQTNEVLMTNEDIKLANILYGSNSSTSTGTAVYLNIEFTKEGTKKLEDISSKYVKKEETTDTENQEETTEEATEEANTTEETEKKITMKIDNEEIMSTSFDEPIKTGKLRLSVGSTTTDTETLNEYAGQANSMAIVLDKGNMPIKYTVSENKYVLSDITNEQLEIVKYIIIAVVAIALIVLIIRYHINGLLGTISYIGLASIFTLLIRYANVVLSIEGIFGIAIILILNYIFTNKILAKLKEEKKEKTSVSKLMKETYQEFFVRIIPICIVVIVFCFMNWAPISSFGMVMFWGIALIALYNFIVTNNLLKIKANK